MARKPPERAEPTPAARQKQAEPISPGPQEQVPPERGQETKASGEPPPFRVRLPVAFNEDIGLGDVIGRATSYIGIQPCRGCKGRAAWLNQRFVITGKR